MTVETARTILFDVGNTLTYVDTDPIARVARELGHEVADDRLRRLEPLARADMYGASGARDIDRWGVYLTSLLGRAGLTGEEAARARAVLAERHPVSSLWCRVESDTPEVLATLRSRGYSLGVISNSDGRVSELLRSVHLHRFFDAVVDSHRVGVEKPEPRIFEIALERMGRPATSGLYVGDFYAVDVVGARRAGLVPVLLDPLETASGVDCAVIRRLGDLLDLLPDPAPPEARAT